MPLTAPLRTSLELAALPSAVPSARGHVRAAARESGLAHLADVAELLASELVTNAVRASAGTGDPVLLCVTCHQASILIHVWDASSQMPQRKDAGPDAEGGRGLMLVEALATGWDCYRQQDGKVIWGQVSSS
jgi:anti-sigma regulatory factor (Ser/Thr protein kinase)